ncbi:unnamed protein product [Closterium sp. NIES-64]|nr:unnamed protein product [Closterium sp. NIES-64]
MSGTNHVIQPAHSILQLESPLACLPVPQPVSEAQEPLLVFPQAAVPSVRNGRVRVTNARRIRSSSGRTGGWGKRVAEFIPNFAIALTIYLTVHAFVLPSTLPGITDPSAEPTPPPHDPAPVTATAHRRGRPSREWTTGRTRPSLPRRRILRAASSDDLVDVDDLDMVHNQNMPLPDWARDIPSMTIFCAPKPYLNTPEDPQRRALLSWLRLRPQPKVVLLGSDPSFDLLAQEFPGSVFVDSTIDTNFYGVPLFHAMVARAQAADTPLSMLINGDIILLSDIVPAIGRVQAFSASGS